MGWRHGRSQGYRITVSHHRKQVLFWRWTFSAPPFNDVKYCRLLSVLRLKLITDNDYTRTYPHTGPFATGLITLSVFSSLVSELK